MANYSVALKSFVDEMGLTAVYCPDNYDSLMLTSSEVNRPALVLSGYTQYFDTTRVQVLGRVEMSYLDTLSPERLETAVETLFSFKPATVVVSRSLAISNDIIEAAKKYGVPLFSTAEKTSHFMSAAISYLSVELAPRVFRHGVMVEVYGEGILLLGESGVGKSETAIELIKRGHRLIADDSVELRRVSDRTIVGTSPANIRHFIEIRGIGIVNARKLFGVGSVKLTERVDIIIELEQWQQGKNYSVIAPEQETMSILGVKIPKLTVPVRPGRNLAVIVEIAAMNDRQRKLGYDPVKDLMANLSKE